MHELSIVFEIAKQVDQVAIENHVKKVSSVTMEIGEVSMIVNPYLIDCWNWTRKKYDTLHECELLIEDVHAVTYCEDCHKEYDTVPQGKICPFCGSEHTYLVRGNEINIKEISVLDEDQDEEDEEK